MSQSYTKQKLIDAAIKVFSEKGYFNTRVSDIVKEAGVAQGTFYIYFKSKEDAFYFIVNMITSQLYEIIGKYENLSIPPKEKIINFAQESFTQLEKYKEIAKILFFQLMCIDKKFQDIHINTNNRIKEFYLKTLNELPESEIIADVILGFGKRLFEFDLLMDNKPIDEIIEKFKKGVGLVLRD